MEKSVLFGNGLNIAFSGNSDYCNRNIIERLLAALDTDRFTEVFCNTITPSEIKQMIYGLNEQFKRMLKDFTAFRWTNDDEEMRALLDIIMRYKRKSPDIMEVSMEDYFYVMKWFNNHYKEEPVDINSLYLGLKFLFLDAIYNEGQIESIYTKMGCLRKELDLFDNIFTVNYDTNLDKLSSKEVYHLHGSYNVLDDTYKSNTIIGYIASQKENPPTYIHGLEYLYCNAIMGYSGEYKKSIIDTYSNSNRALGDIIPRLQNPLDTEARDKVEACKTSPDEKLVFAYKTIMAKLNHPELSNTEYPFVKFESISGDLYIIGMSPNNDKHIFDAINNNSNIRKVIYYSASIEDTDAAQRVISKTKEIRNVYKYWKTIMR
jgi:hypothetical protein